MDFTGLPVWAQDLIPWLTWGTLAGVFILTVWQIFKTVYKFFRHDKSAAD